MQFTAWELEEILRLQDSDVEIYNEDSHLLGVVRPNVALREVKRVPCFGVGNRKRIRYLRLARQQFPLNAGSSTTKRLQGQNGPIGDRRTKREHRWNVEVHPFRR